jgi:G:T-mismatch repair DNA endonuclease (very short patch repair protein)
VDFFGDYWHCNPANYTDDYWHKGMKRTAREVRLKDADRINKIKSLGHDVQIIWESDFKSSIYIPRSLIDYTMNTERS